MTGDARHHSESLPHSEARFRSAGQARVDEEIRALLAELTGDDRPLTAPSGTPLLRDGIGLDSLGGTMLLTMVHRRFGVDVPGEDLNLDSLATIGTLVAFVAARLGDQAPGLASR